MELGFSRELRFDRRCFFPLPPLSSPLPSSLVPNLSYGQSVENLITLSSVANTTKAVAPTPLYNVSFSPLRTEAKWKGGPKG